MRSWTLTLLLFACGSPTTTTVSDAAFADSGTTFPTDSSPTGDSAPPPPSCDRVSCGGHGKCSIGPTGATCTCESGYHAVGSTCVSDVSDLGMLETLVADMAAGSWREITGTPIEDVLMTPEELGAIDPNLHAVSAPTMGDNPNGVYQKCIHVPELDVFAGYNNASEGVWLYRLP